MSDTADVVVIGGAVIGSAVAYWLTQDPAFTGRVIVLEADPTYATAASPRSTSGVRHQFSTGVNIALTQFTTEFLRDAAITLDIPGDASGVILRENGYLFLGGPAMVPDFEANHRLQRSVGADVILLGPDELAARFPWLNLDGVAVGSLGVSGEGWTDGHLLMNALKRRARAAGAEYRTLEATGLLRHGDRVTGVRCADGSEISCGRVVNAAGRHGRDVASWAGIALPIRNLKQTVFSFESPFKMPNAPFTMGPQRLLFRPEGADYITSLGIDDEAGEIADWEVDESIFLDEIWPLLAERVPAFEQLRLRGGWAGHYDMNLFDHNAIVGAVDGVPGFYLANGFSGHGLMQSPGVGRAVAELIMHGHYRTIDLSELAFSRIAADAPLHERIQY